MHCWLYSGHATLIFNKLNSCYNRCSGEVCAEPYLLWVWETELFRYNIWRVINTTDHWMEHTYVCTTYVSTYVCTYIHTYIHTSKHFILLWDIFRNTIWIWFQVLQPLTWIWVDQLMWAFKHFMVSRPIQILTVEYSTWSSAVGKMVMQKNQYWWHLLCHLSYWRYIFILGA